MEGKAGTRTLLPFFDIKKNLFTQKNRRDRVCRFAHICKRLLSAKGKETVRCYAVQIHILRNHRQADGDTERDIKCERKRENEGV